MQTRLFTSPVMTKAEVQLWCQLVRDNKGRVSIYELEIKSALNQLVNRNKKAAS